MEKRGLREVGESMKKSLEAYKQTGLSIRSTSQRH